MRSRQNTKDRTFGIFKYSCDTIKNKYLHNLQFVFLFRRLTTLLVFRHLCVSSQLPSTGRSSHCSGATGATCTKLRDEYYIYVYVTMVTENMSLQQ